MKASGLLASALSAAAIVVLAQEKASAVLVYQLVETPSGLRLSTNGTLSNLKLDSSGASTCGAGSVGAIGPAGLCTGADGLLFDFVPLTVSTSPGITQALTATSATPGSVQTFLDFADPNSGPRLYLGSGFVDGQPIFAESFFDNQTFVALGLAPGSLIGSWDILDDAGALVDSIQFRTGPFGNGGDGEGGGEGSGDPTSVPGPLGLAGGAAAFAWTRRLRNRIRRSTTTRG